MGKFEGCNFSDHLKHIDEVIFEFEQRFADFKELESDLSLFTHPLTIQIESVKTEYQIELCDLQSDPFYKERQVQLLLIHEELGDRKPSQVLRHLCNIAGQMVPDYFLRTICRERRSSAHRYRSRSRSRTPKSNYCWYHNRFDVRANKCNEPCSFKSGNDNGSH
ncbi:unnamed protein product [Euphydryas editha]|uniref:Uncharacterized protein n=1 Tax=Euphydryas editha TaxID=104508 RepID=A0AAU9THZ6_EUPED|nr:unnamed protein product [Euphydryas editha]